MKKVFLLILILVLSLGLTISTSGSSAGDEGATPPPAGGGGSGGTPDFYDYFVPLVFNSSHPNGESEVVVWLPGPAAVITTFAQDGFGSSVSQVQEPTKIVFSPSKNRGLTNGSLIRITSPALVSGQRVTEDITSDISFAYSILPRRMMGFEYISPFNGYLSILSLNQETEIRVTFPDGTFFSETILIPGQTLQIPVVTGAYINSTFPTKGAFISYEEGISASMAVPRYFHGQDYVFDADLYSLKDVEIDRSYIRITPSEPTEIVIGYINGTSSQINVFGTTDLKLDPNINKILSLRGKVEVNIRTKIDYGGNTRSSTIQLIDIEEMKAAEIFITPEGFSSHFAVASDDTGYNATQYDDEEGQYYFVTRKTFVADRADIIDYTSITDQQLVIAGNYMFGVIVSPGEVNHPMAPSVAFLNIPVNTATLRNETGLNATWYRFANLAVTELDIRPGPVEEYTGQTIYIEITANGTLPASGFDVVITIDGEVEIDERYDFLQVNETITFEIRKFLNFGKTELNITIDVDTENEVSEINEDDNSMIEGYDVQRNIRLRWSGYLVIALTVVFVTFRFRKLIKSRQTLRRAHVDAILSFEGDEGA